MSMVYLWYVYHFKGGAWFWNYIPTVCNGVCIVPRVGLGVELAAMCVWIWLSRVGLAAMVWVCLVGLAATIAELTG